MIFAYNPIVISHPTFIYVIDLPRSYDLPENENDNMTIDDVF